MKARIMLYADVRNEWRWRLFDEHNRVIAVSSGGYVHKADALNAIDLLKSLVPSAEIEDQS